MQFVKSYYFSVLNIVAINDFPDETWEKEFGHLQLLNVPPALFLRVWRITRCFGHIPVCANGVRPLKVCFAVLIGLDPFLHIKEPAFWNSLILVEIEETILLSLGKSLESNYTVLGIVRVNLYPVCMFSSGCFLFYN